MELRFHRRPSIELPVAAPLTFAVGTAPSCRGERRPPLARAHALSRPAAALLRVRATSGQTSGLGSRRRALNYRRGDTPAGRLAPRVGERRRVPRGFYTPLAPPSPASSRSLPPCVVGGERADRTGRSERGFLTVGSGSPWGGAGQVGSLAAVGGFGSTSLSSSSSTS